MRRSAVLASALFLLASLGSGAFAADSSGLARSNENARLLIEVQARFGPEGAGAMGVDGLDEAVTAWPPDYPAQELQAIETAEAELKRRLAAERDPAVRQDLEILIDAGAVGE